MAWYDVFAGVYDASVERVYAPYRARIAEALGDVRGGVVLDLPVGTGPNLPHLRAAVGPQGAVVGVDLSSGMLRRCRARCAQEGWTDVHLLERDARAVTAADLAEATGREGGLDGVVVTLGLTVFPDWEQVFASTFALLRPGGRYVIFDVHAERWVLQTCIVSLMAQADMGREVWRPLEAAAEGYEREVLEGSVHVHGGHPFLASGRKPA
ncbi:MAG: class I SAM-dependent methyltransferase [Alphaproteobacteria bacterium]|nr:class I SAM-dependent methyltransferase [Alphaproteobacteria bacterium]